MVPHIENPLRILPDDVAEATSCSVSSVFLTRRPQPCNLPKDTFLVLKALKSDKSITERFDAADVTQKS